MMDPGYITAGGAALGMTIAGAGALRILWAGARAIDRVPAAAERAAAALEKQTVAEEKSATLIGVIERFEEERLQMARTLRIIARKIGANPDDSE